MKKLTQKKIAALVRAGRKGRHGDGGGLCLQIINRDNASWLFRFQRGGREHAMGLGPLRLIDLPEARLRARAAERLLLDGVDPLAQRQQARTAAALEAARTISFADCAQMFFDHHREKWSSAKHAGQFMSTLRQHVFPILGKLPVADIDTAAVLKALEKPWKETPETAARVRTRIENVLAFATVRQYRKGENPARWKGHLDQMLHVQRASKKHHAALPYIEMPKFMVELGAIPGVPARALEFLIMTGGRTSEVIRAKWSEIDMQAGVWTIPAARMKTRRDHRVALSGQALALLAALPRETDHVFPGARRGIPVANNALLRLLKRMGRTDFVVHGLRSTFRVWASERTTFPPDLIEAAMSHHVGNAVERAYSRSDLLAKRAALMSNWADYLYAPTPAETVVPIRARV